MKSLKRDGSSRNQYCRHWSVADEQDVDTSTLHHGVINSTINSYRHKFQICLQKLRSRDYRKNFKVLQGQLQEHHKLLQDCCLLQRPKRLTQVRSIRVGCNDVARWLRSLYEIVGWLWRLAEVIATSSKASVFNFLWVISTIWSDFCNYKWEWLNHPQRTL